MNNEIKNEIYNIIQNRIEIASRDKKIEEIYKKNKDKIHFMPMNFRILGGILQSLNIQFGPFIENFVKVLVNKSNIYEVDKISGKRIKWDVSKNKSIKIEEYINDRKTKTNKIKLNDVITEKYIIDEDIKKSFKKIDVDMLIKKDKEYHLFEIKVSDDHNTGKIESIAKKLLETYFSLKNKFDKEKIEYSKISFYVYYFNKTIKFLNLYFKEDENVIRGDLFFKKFTIFHFSEIENIFNNISEDKKTIQKFKNLYEKIIEK